MRVFRGFPVLGFPFIGWVSTPVDFHTDPPELVGFLPKAAIRAEPIQPPVYFEVSESANAALGSLHKRRFEDECPADTTICYPFHGNCCNNAHTCCGLGCCPEGTICVDNENGKCCEKGAKLCANNICTHGDCCSDDFYCRGLGETCCGFKPNRRYFNYGGWRSGVGVGFGPDDQSAKRGGLRCCKHWEYCWDGQECRLKPVSMANGVFAHGEEELLLALWFIFVVALSAFVTYWLRQ